MFICLLVFSFSFVLTENSSFRKDQGRTEINYGQCKNIRALNHLVSEILAR